MTDWKEFWMGLGAIIYPGETLGIAILRGVRVGSTGGSQYPNWRYVDPHDPSIPLEVLLDGLEKVLPFYGITKKEVDGKHHIYSQWAVDIDNDYDLRAAVIAAICKLLGIKEDDNGN